MNKVILMGRLTRDPEIRYTQGQQPMCVARYTIAVDRRSRDQQADFISCVAFGKLGEFAGKYLHQGTKICLEGHIQTGSYTDRDGRKVYTTDVVVDSNEFAESKAVGEQQTRPEATAPAEAYTYDSDGWGHIPESADDEGLPFN